MFQGILARVRSQRHSWLFSPFGADGWWRVAYALTGPFIGRDRRHRLAAHFGGPSRAGAPRWLTLPLSVLAFALAALIVYLIGRVVTYGLSWNPDDKTAAADSWGGPTLAGAWIVHALIAIAITTVTIWLLVPLTNVTARGNR
jgi:hypothetical protein